MFQQLIGYVTILELVLFLIKNIYVSNDCRQKIKSTYSRIGSYVFAGLLRFVPGAFEIDKILIGSAKFPNSRLLAGLFRLGTFSVNSVLFYIFAIDIIQSEI